MARKQVAILSINRGVTTLNGLVVERQRGENPHQAGLRAVTEQLAAPSRRPVQVVATDDHARLRMYVHPDGQVSDIETLDVFDPPGADADPVDAWVAVPPRSVDETDEGPVADEPEVYAAEPVEPEAEPDLAEPDLAEPDLAEPEPVPPAFGEPEPVVADDPDRTAERPRVVVPTEPEPEPMADDLEDVLPTVAIPPMADEPVHEELLPPHHRPPAKKAVQTYRRPRGRVTARGRVVLVVAGVLVLILAYSAVRAIRSMCTDDGLASAVASPAVNGSPTPSATTSATTSAAPSPTPKPTPTPVRTTPAAKPSTAPPAKAQAYTRTLTVKAVSMTEAIELRITASRLPATATIRMDPWGAPAPFTTTVRLTQADQSVVIKPVASGHAEWSVKVDGARTVKGYTHSWPKGERVIKQ